jgi:radical SAM protein with 4Fe4S-binding SPASM domain
MMIDQLSTGDKVHKYQRCLVIPFEGKRKVMSTSMHNGGYREDLTAVFNHDVNPGPGMPCEYCGQAEEKTRQFIIDDLGLDYESVAYMANIKSMTLSSALKSESCVKCDYREACPGGCPSRKITNGYEYAEGSLDCVLRKTAFDIARKEMQASAV